VKTKLLDVTQSTDRNL